VAELNQNLDPLIAGAYEGVDGTSRGRRCRRTVSQPIKYTEKCCFTADCERNSPITGDALSG
jgi:hypothetical protein